MDLTKFIEDNFETLAKIAIAAISAIVGVIGGNYLHRDTAPDYKYGTQWSWVWMWSLICASVFTAAGFLLVTFFKSEKLLVAFLMLEIIANIIAMILYCRKKVFPVMKQDKIAKSNTIMLVIISIIGAWSFMLVCIEILFSAKVTVFKFTFEKLFDRILLDACLFVIFEILGGIVVIFLSRANRVKKYSCVDVSYSDKTETIIYDKRGQKGDYVVFERNENSGDGKRHYFRYEIKKSEITKMYFYNSDEGEKLISDAKTTEQAGRIKQDEDHRDQKE